MKTTCIMLCALTLAVAGCSAEAPGDDSPMASEEAALSTANAATKRAIKAAVGFFAGGDTTRTREIKINDAPAEIAPGLERAYAEMVDELSNDGWGSESDFEKGVYEVFKSPTDHVVVGYAIWMYGDNGDAGRGLLRGFDLNGRQIVTDEDSWAEN
jgi:hypothetical protein